MHGRGRESPWRSRRCAVVALSIFAWVCIGVIENAQAPKGRSCVHDPKIETGGPGELPREGLSVRSQQSVEQSQQLEIDIKEANERALAYAKQVEQAKEDLRGAQEEIKTLTQQLEEVQSRYHTEKLLNAIIARTVPIYFGHHDTVGSIFNPKRFIHCSFDVDGLVKKSDELGLKGEGETRIDFVKEHAAEDLKRCVEAIKRVDQNDTLWREMVEQPMLPGNRIEGTPFDLRPISRALRKAIELHQPSWL
eukprot:jgi/Bigna1/144792/aug1.91_g19500